MMIGIDRKVLDGLILIAARKCPVSGILLAMDRVIFTQFGFCSTDKARSHQITQKCREKEG